MYNIDYFYNMLRMYSPTAKQICEIRWNFVKECKPRVVLDYGSGCGFFKAFAPKGIEVDTYDLIEVPQTGINHDDYDLITFWDVLEHCESFEFLNALLKKTDWVAVTVPIKPDNVKWDDYKHYKPLEHIHHFQHESLAALFKTFGFKCVIAGQPECPPREMIGSFLFRRAV